jgi:RNA polymerase sigma factor (sigma-70 family)
MKGSEDDDVNQNYMENDAWNMDAAPKEWEADRMVKSKEFMEVLDQCRDRLSELQQAVFTLKYIDGESSEDICKELDITSSNYWVLAHRAKHQLRNCLEIKWMT